MCRCKQLEIQYQPIIFKNINSQMYGVPLIIWKLQASARNYKVHSQMDEWMPNIFLFTPKTDPLKTNGHESWNSAQMLNLQT